MMIQDYFNRVVGEEEPQKKVWSLDKDLRLDVYSAVKKALNGLADDPALVRTGHLGRSTYDFRFEAGGTYYWWAAVTEKNLTEIVVTQFCRSRNAIL